MLARGSQNSTRTPSLHSDPDPADEDCIPSRKASQELNKRPGLQNARLPSYTNFLSTRTFSPEVKVDAKWAPSWAHSESPTNRAVSEGTSNNEDWRTALNGSPHSQSELSRNGSQARNDQPSLEGALHRNHATRSPVLKSLTQTYDLNTGAQGKTNANHGHADQQNNINQPQSASSPVEQGTDTQRTPQARRRLSPARQEQNPSTDVISELADLKRRIHELELSPAAFHRSPSVIGHSPHSVERRRPTTDQGSPGAYARPSDSLTHPLLRTTIHTIRNSNLSADLVRPLDLAVSDALALSTMAVDRVVRSRVDGLCRSLTSICLHLQEQEQFRSNAARDTVGEMRARSDIFVASHSRNHSIGSSVGIRRSRSSRRSLADILKSAPDRIAGNSASSVAGASEISSVPRSREYRAFAESHRDYDAASVTAPPRHNSSRLSMYSNMAPNTSSARSARSIHTEIHHGDVGQTSLSSRYSREQRSTSREREMNKFLNRSPVTREALYDKYHRGSPHRS